MNPLVGEARGALIAMFALLAVALVPLVAFKADPVVAVVVGLAITLTAVGVGIRRIIESDRRSEVSRG